jgi:hypothetical protein
MTKFLEQFIEIEVKEDIEKIKKELEIQPN